jgi:serine/threonine-protein kinase
MALSTKDELFLSGLAELTKVGRYEIIKRLGQGSSGVVFLGRDPYINRHVAIKVSPLVSDRVSETFFLEVQSAGRLTHPNVVAVYDAGVTRDYCYIAMEYVNGPKLEDFCQPSTLKPPAQALEILFNVCKGLDYAHKQGVVHRDIKPTNLMMDEKGLLKITDFGVAQLTGRTAQMGVFGTPSYMAPEILKEEGAGPQADIFAAGCVLYELLTGQKAFPGENYYAIMYKIIHNEPPPASSLRKGLPGILDKIVAKALAKDIADRYQNCADMAYELRVGVRALSGAADGPAQKSGDVVEYVQQVPFFRDFTKAQVKGLLNASEIVRKKRGEIIVAEGEIDDSLYVILTGRARVSKGGVSIAQVALGECFGEMAYIGGQPRAADVIAETEVILVKINGTLLDRAPMQIQLLFFKRFAFTLVQRLAKSAQQKKDAEAY